MKYNRSNVGGGGQLTVVIIQFLPTELYVDFQQPSCFCIHIVEQVDFFHRLIIIFFDDDALDGQLEMVEEHLDHLKVLIKAS
jgi:hypothetical protein